MTAGQIAAGGTLVNTVAVTSAQTATAVSATASTVIAGAPLAPVPVPLLGWLAWLMLAGGTGLAALVVMRRRAA